MLVREFVVRQSEPKNIDESSSRKVHSAQRGLSLEAESRVQANRGFVVLINRDGDLLVAKLLEVVPEDEPDRFRCAPLVSVGSVDRATVAEGAGSMVTGMRADRANWQFLSKQVRVGKEVVDYFHATEHLSEGLKAAYGEATGRHRRRFMELGDILLTEPDGVDQVIAALRELREACAARQAKSILEREEKFFAKNRPRMQYAALRACGLPVGSGVQEAACKTLATQRLKQSGMQWAMEGGQAILTSRVWCQSGRFDEAWALIAARYRVEVTVISNVVDLASYKNHAKTPSI